MTIEIISPRIIQMWKDYAKRRFEELNKPNKPITKRNISNEPT